MSSDQPSPTVDWGEERVILGRRFLVWQLNLYSLLLVLFIAFVGFYFAAPFLPFYVMELGVADPRAAAVWSGVLIGLPLFTATVNGGWLNMT